MSSDNPLNSQPPFEPSPQPQQPQPQPMMPQQPMPPQQAQSPQPPAPPVTTALVASQTVTEALPVFVQPGTAGLEKVADFIMPPRVKVIQGQSDQGLKQAFGEGAIILTPNNIMVAPPGGTFHFVPIYFQAEYCTWNPIQLKGQLNVIRARSMDPNSVIARKAANPDTRKEPCPENPEFFLQHSCHLGYVIAIIGDNPAANIPVSLSFYRGEFMAGSNFAGLLRMCGQNIYACQFEAKIVSRTNAQGRQWWGIDVANPSPETGVNPWVQDENAYKFYESLYEKYKATDVQIVYDEDPQAAAAGGNF